MSATDQTRRKLDLGQVFGDTFAVLKRQWALIFAISIVLIFVPGIIRSAFVIQALQASPGAPFAYMQTPLNAGVTLVSALLGTFALCSQIHIAVSDLDGRRPDWGEILGVAARKTLPMLLLTILVVVGASLGMILLVFPGLILYVMWSVSLPAGIAETSNPWRAMRRSRDLTRGNRWRIFGLLLVIGLVWIAFGMVLFGFGGAAAAMTAARGLSFDKLVLSTVISLLTSVVTAVGSAALYVQLRNLQSGAGGEAVAQVFE